MIDFENAFTPVDLIIDRGFFVSVFLWQQMKFSGNFFNKRTNLAHGFQANENPKIYFSL
jgi:hypothetical protein